MLQTRQEIAPLTDVEFERFRHLARTTCGISLQATKKAMVSSRLERLLRRNGWGSYAGYLDLLAKRPGGQEWVELIDCLTTNHTWFFREAEHFSFLQREVFGHVPGQLRIWSSACATGEEPYSIAMLAQESGVQNIEILATDISRSALAEAERGEYEEARLNGLDASFRARYLVRPSSGKPGKVTVSPAVRRLVKFQPLNLLTPVEMLGRFHVVFCRNVMIYFERDTQEQLVAKLAARLHPGGYLFTGHSESLLRLPDSLAYVKPAIYRKVS